MIKNTLAGVLLTMMVLSVSGQAASVVVQNASFNSPALGSGGYTGNNFTDGFTFVYAGVEYPDPNGNQFNFSGGAPAEHG